MKVTLFAQSLLVRFLLHYAVRYTFIAVTFFIRLKCLFYAPPYEKNAMFSKSDALQKYFVALSSVIYRKYLTIFYLHSDVLF